MELAGYDNAVDYYTKAADYKPNKYFTPTYLLKAALAYEKLSDLQKAKDVYQKIVDDFYDSNEVQKAKKHLARLEVLTSS
jgi:tetratricopeptide (TPR) repeat protein